MSKKRMPRVARLIVGLSLGGFVTAGVAAAQPYSVVHEFYRVPGYPLSPLVEAPDGKLYGGTNESVYALVPDGGGGYTHVLLHRFTFADGIRPHSLLLASDGLLYGTTEAGGAADFGVIFRIDGDGVFSVLHEFSGADGIRPLGLVEGADGAFYGTTQVGGPDGPGTVFRIEAAGTLTTLHAFSSDTGATPLSPLILASDGDFYGTTSFPPTVFRITDTGDLSTIVTLGIDQQPLGIVEGSDGLFYGTTTVLPGGGAASIVFRVSAGGDFDLLHTFSAHLGATSVLIEAADGNFYGANGPTDFPPQVGAGIYRVSPDGTYEDVHAFSGPEGSGSTALLEASDGKLYGASPNGGTNGYGTVFRMSLAGVVELVFDFGVTESAGIVAPLIPASDGTLLGHGTFGGENGRGSVFRLGLPDDFSLLHAFEEGRCAPGSPFVEGDGGDLYGVSLCGGEFSHGEFYKIDSAGSLQVLESFENYGDGPTALMRASDGNFYGITETGLRVAMLDPAGNLSYPFDFEFPAFAYPGSILVEGPDGRLYGTMAIDAGETRALFRIEESGALTVVVAFPPNVWFPNPLTLGSDGWFYGTSQYDGSLGAGSVFRVNTAGVFEPLYAFRPSPSGDANYPAWGLTEGPDGAFYGPAYGGPTLAGSGAIFRVDNAGHASIAHSFRGGEEGDWPAQLALGSDGALYAPAYRFDVGYPFLFRLDPASVLLGLTAAPGSGAAAGGTPVTIGGPLEPGASVTFGPYAAEAVAGIAAAGTGGFEVVAPAVAPGYLYHVIVRNPDGAEGSIPNAWFADFRDVPQADIFHASVEKIFRAGITAGCSGGNYCRNAPVTRAQMAVFLLKAKHGYLYAPPRATGLVFGDVPIDAFAAAWIEQLAALEIAAGCGGGNYCPNDPVTRAQMAVFLLKTLMGSDYTPPPATGTVFEDVPANAFAADFIEDLAGRGITGGCSATPPLYCPDDPNTRGQMAVFLSTTFSLP